MNKKILFRIIGALSSSLVILSVFVPFFNIISNSLWDIYSIQNGLYLPIIIIAFGVIGITFFALNIKTEFAYLTSGASIFFGLSELFSAGVSNSIGNLGLGFYFLIVGGITTGIMAFLCNLREKVTSITPVQDSQTVINQSYVDRIAIGNQDNSNSMPINMVTNNPMPPASIPNIVEPVQPIQPTPIPNIVEPVQPVQPAPIPNIVEPVQPVQPAPIPNIVDPVQPVQPAPISNNVEPIKNDHPVPNPVIMDFMNQPNNEHSSIDFNLSSSANPQPNLVQPSNQNNNTNMNGLDIFGDFK